MLDLKSTLSRTFDLGKVQTLLVKALQVTTAEAVAVTRKQLIAGIPAQRVADWVHFLVWHETYHVGQTELLRQLTSLNDKVI